MSGSVTLATPRGPRSRSGCLVANASGGPVIRGQGLDCLGSERTSGALHLAGGW
jgi:hypothetical protein